MRKSVLALVGLAVAIIFIAFVASRRKNSTSQNPEAGRDMASQASTNESKLRPRPPIEPNNTQRATNTHPTPNVSTPVVTNANYMTNWEDKLDTILTSEKPDPDKAKEMIDLFPHLSPDAQ